MNNSIDFTAIPLAKRPEPKVWQVISEQVSAGQATILQVGNEYAVQFPDEDEPVPFERLGYHHELGLYDKRQFPNL
jgi:hypothetical protein